MSSIPYRDPGALFREPKSRSRRTLQARGGYPAAEVLKNGGEVDETKHDFFGVIVWILFLIHDECYRHPAVHPPSLDRVAEIAKSLNLDLTNEELKQYRDAMTKSINTSYQRVYDLVEPKLPVKYPRTPGHKPYIQENPLNAWYWKCDITGAPNGKLHGKTIAIKDSIAVAGVPMMNGSLILEGFIPDIDATVVTRVLDQGGRIPGKSNVREFVATGEVDMALGGDQGGSIRMPAASCGIVGLKPTMGLVPYTGISSMELTIDYTGPMARTVYDTALLLESIAGLDGAGLDPRQPSDLKIPEYTKQLSGDINGLHIGLVKEGFDPKFESDVNELVKKSAERLGDVGAVVEEVSIPWHKDVDSVLFTYSVADTSAFMYYDTHLQQAIARGMKTHPHDHPPTVTLSRLIARYMREDYYGVFYSKAQNLRRELVKAYDEALQKYDVLIMPTCPRKASSFPSQNPSVEG
ncbi:hypothetical protein QZH41_011937, partial [Actinostola sp. cb2023]